MIFEAEVFYNGNDHLKGEAEELLSNLREEFLKEELMKKMQELNVAERDKDKEKSNKILGEVNDLNIKIQNIKSGRKKN